MPMINLPNITLRYLTNVQWLQLWATMVTHLSSDSLTCELKKMYVQFHIGSGIENYEIKYM